MAEDGGTRKGGNNPGRGTTTNPLRIAAQERVSKALELRKAGVTFALIAEKCGYKTAQHAHKAVKAAILAIPRENAIEARYTELDRLDRLMLGAWERAIKGDTEAGDYILRIMKRRAALAGLDAPVKAQVDNTGVTTLRWEDAEPGGESEPDPDAPPPSGPAGDPEG